MHQAAQTLTVKRTYKFRLITPNTPAGAAQRATFAQLAGASRVVWNAGVAYLNDRRENPEKYDDGKKRVYAATALVGTCAVAIPQLRETREWFARLETRGCKHILRHPLWRLDDAVDAAFGRLVKIQAQRAAGKSTRQQAGFPKFHAKREDESFTVPDGWKTRRADGKYDHSPVRISESRKRILLPGVLNRLEKGKRKMPKGDDRHLGWIRLNRKIPEAAVVKCAVIKRDGQKWFAFLQCDVQIAAPPPHSDPHVQPKAIGLDMNVEERAQIAASDGRMFPAALGENEFASLEKSKSRAMARRKRYERRMSRLRDIALRERAEWNGKNTTRKSAEKRLKDSHLAEIESRRSHRVIVAGPHSVLRRTLADACEKAGVSAERLEDAGVLRLLAHRQAPTRKFFAANIAETAPGVSLPQWRRAKMELDKLLPRNRRRQKFGESKYGVHYQIQRTRKRRASARVKNIRANFGHRVSAELTRECAPGDMIGAEALHIPAMTASAKGTKENPGKNVRAKAGMNRQMLDKSFGGLRDKIAYKAEAKGGEFITTPYAYTSQACNNCAEVDENSRKSTARFKCIHCGHGDDAQTNAAKNVLAVALKIKADPEAAKNIPPGPSKRTKEFVKSAIGEYGGASGNGRTVGGIASGDGRAYARTGGKGARKAAKAAAEKSAGSLPPTPPRGKRREITPAKARNRATKAPKESGLFPDSSAKSIRCAGKGGTTP